jgi:hypothetical protein
VKVTSYEAPHCATFPTLLPVQPLLGTEDIHCITKYSHKCDEQKVVIVSAVAAQCHAMGERFALYYHLLTHHTQPQQVKVREGHPLPQPLQKKERHTGRNIMRKMCTTMYSL